MNNENTVQCGLCQENKPLSDMASEIVWGDQVCNPCMSTMSDYKTDKDSEFSS